MLKKSVFTFGAATLFSAFIMGTAFAHEDEDEDPNRQFGYPQAGLIFEMLVEANETAAAGELEIAHVTWPERENPVSCRDKECQPHQHPVIEIFYILEGEMESVVDGEIILSGPGDIVVAQPNQDIVHNPMSPKLETLVIWLGGVESDRLIEAFGFQEVGPAKREGSENE